MRARSLAPLSLVLFACGSSTPNPTPPAASAASASASASAPATAPASATASATATAPAAATASASDDTKEANDFTFRLFRKVKAGNALVSPASVRQAMGIVYLGAKGDTAREMATTLGYASDRSAAEAAAKAETAAWDAAKGKAELAVANRVWLDGKLPVAQGYLDVTKSAYGASPELVDFRANAEGARKTINAWVADRTNHKIEDLLPGGSVNASSRMVVTNAIYFKGAWVFPFPPAGTKEEPFKVDDKKTVKAPLMHLTDSFRMAQGNGAKVLELRYQDTDVAMLVVLPDDAKGLAKLEAEVSADTLDAWTKGLASGRVAVTLPKFTFRSGGSIAPWLKELGVKSAFTDKADFSDITAGKEALGISDVIHQTYVATDEKGTEAAAATAVVMRTTGLMTGPVGEFKADRPFLFFLREGKRGRVLFAGRVTDPTAKGN